MVIQIFDKEANPKNLMAEGIVDLTKVLNEKEHDGYFPLSFRGRPESGFIYLELTFYSTVCLRTTCQLSILTLIFSKTRLLDLYSK